MAIVETHFPARGSSGDTTFRNLHGQTVMSLKKKFNKAHWQESSRCAFARRAAREFGGASKAATVFYRHLRTMGNLLAPYTQNTILKTILKAGRLNEPTRAWPGHPKFIDRFTAKHCATALTGLKLSPQRKEGAQGAPIPAYPAPSFFRPDGQPVRRTASHVPLAGGITITGLREVAAALAEPRKELSCRIHILYIPFIDHVWDGEEYLPLADTSAQRHVQSTLWIPADGLPEQIALKIKTPDDICSDRMAYVAIAVVEWMATHGRRPKYYRDAATVLVLGTLHPDLPNTPPTPAKPARRFHPAARRASARGASPTACGARPRISSTTRAKVAISAFAYLYDKSTKPGGHDGRFANPKWSPAPIRRKPALVEH